MNALCNDLHLHFTHDLCNDLHLHFTHALYDDLLNMMITFID